MRHNRYSYCNPLPIPDYPVVHNDEKGDTNEDFREMADPSVIYHDGKWYMYPSCGMVYWTEDLINWQYTPIEPANVVPYAAPTVMEYKGKFYLHASHMELYVSDSPLGPFEKLGYIRQPSGEVLWAWDPMLFADDDDRVYLYWGCGNGGIFGVELDQNDLTQAITEVKMLFATDISHEWEGGGSFNQDKRQSWTEGGWMYKENGTYYLTYVGPNTEFPTYAMGVYKSDKPLEGFVYAQRNPFLIQHDGLIRGTGHGCIVKGPNDTRWVFYTCLVGYYNLFERRVGVDPVGIDENGDLYCIKATEHPQMKPGLVAKPEDGNGTGDVCLTCFQPRKATSAAPGRAAVYALDHCLHTWWQPADADKAPALTVDLRGEYAVRSARVMWNDVGMNTEAGILPGPYGYRITAKTRDGAVVLADMSDNTDDLFIDYIEIPETDNVSEVTLEITKAPKGITPGVVDFSVFGYMKM